MLGSCAKLTETFLINSQPIPLEGALDVVSNVKTEKQTMRWKSLTEYKVSDMISTKMSSEVGAYYQTLLHQVWKSNSILWYYIV